MSTHTYQTPPNARAQSSQQTITGLPMPPPGPDPIGNASIRSLPDSTQSHLEGIFNAVRTQVASWGENARWKIDLVLLPSEENSITRQNSTGGSPTVSQPNTRIHPNSPSTTTPPYGLSPSAKTVNHPQIPAQQNIPNLALLDESTINNLDLDNAKQLLRQALSYIRSVDVSSSQLKDDLSRKLAEAEAKTTQANKHNDGLTRLHLMREREKDLKHSAELQILQEDVKALHRKIKDANRLNDINQGRTNFQASPTSREGRRVEQGTIQKEKRNSRKKNSPYPLKPERIGEIIEYVPQEQTNGYLTYNFPYIPKLLPSNQLSTVDSPLGSNHKVSTYTSIPHQYRSSTTSISSYDGYDRPGTSTHSDMRTNIGRDHRYFSPRPEDRTGLDNLSLAAEMLLSATSTLIPAVNLDKNGENATQTKDTEIILSETEKGKQAVHQSSTETLLLNSMENRMDIAATGDSTLAAEKIEVHKNQTTPDLPIGRTLITSTGSAPTTPTKPSSQQLPEAPQQQPPPQILEHEPHDRLTHVSLYPPGGPQSPFEFPPKRRQSQQMQGDEIPQILPGKMDDNYASSQIAEKAEIPRLPPKPQVPPVQIYPAVLPPRLQIKPAPAPAVNLIQFTFDNSSSHKLYTFSNTHTPPPTPPAFQKKTRSPYVKWTIEEDQLLRSAVQTHGSKNWEVIAQEVPGRNYLQCRQRWTKVLKEGSVDPNLVPDVTDESNQSSPGGSTSQSAPSNSKSISSSPPLSNITTTNTNVGSSPTLEPRVPSKRPRDSPLSSSSSTQEAESPSGKLIRPNQGNATSDTSEPSKNGGMN